MGCPRRYLISRCLLARPRTKCLSLIAFSIILYTIGTFVSFNDSQSFRVVASDSSRLRHGDVAMSTQRLAALIRQRTVFDEESFESDTGQNGWSNEAQDTTDVVGENIEITNAESNHSAALRRQRRKFLFVFRYYEQLGRATSNLLALASLARCKDRLVVVPFVNNSRMSGLHNGVSHHYRKSDLPPLKNYVPLSGYFNVEDMNNKLKSYGYGVLGNFRDFESQCAKRLNIVVHFLFDDENAKRDASSWYRLTYREVTELYQRAKEHGGWTECPDVKHSRLSRQMGFKVSRYICVDPEIIRTASEFETILNGAYCVGIVQWKGIGPERVHFPLDSSISQPLYPSDFEFNPRLVKIAKEFVRSNFDGEFIGIHVRSERSITRKGYNVTKRCMQKLANRLLEFQNLYQAKGMFLASDLTDYGSDTLIDYAKRDDRRNLSLFLQKVLKNPVIFEPKDVPLYDNGAVAIVEMNILSQATRLFTLGSGNFQQWAIDLFLRRHKNEARRVHRMCEDN